MAYAPPRTAELAFADVFADVFGGPPRRSSGNEHRVSMDSTSFGSSAPRGPSGGAEAPVFGDRGSGDRRRHPGEEFYRDIFPATEVASPRIAAAGDWGDVFGGPASPGSTNRPRSSFSMKFNRGAEISMPTSPFQQTSNVDDDGTSNAYSVSTSPNSQMNNYLAQETPQQDSRKKPFSWHRYPFLSRLRSQSGDKKNTSNHVSSMGTENEETPGSVESIMATNNFHFSFYKWAGKGALLVLPAAMEEKDAAIIGLTSFPQVIVQGFGLIEEEDNMSTATGATKSQTDYEDSKSEKYSTNPATKEEPIPSFFDDEYMQGLKHGTDYSKNDDPSDSPSAKNSRPPAREKSRSSRVKRKVKNFMKIFSPQGSPKRKGASEAQDKTSSVKNESKDELQDNFTLSSPEVNEDVKTNQNNQNTFLLPLPMNEVQKRMETPLLKMNSKVEGNMDMGSEKNEAIPSESTGGARKDILDSATFNHGGCVEDLDECLIVECITEDSVIHNDEEKGNIKIAESKIREWSRGKEGNIRSLLSTLQFVLWPESGWKPIPLVDVIEGAAVKKAYQKALLCLHPDKLQQRGAAMHHKYIAEKVFDILQESWMEFNSVTFG